MIEEVPIKKVPDNCVPVKPLAELYTKQVLKKLLARLNLKTNLKSGFHIRIDNFIPREIWRFIYRAIKEAKDTGVYCKIVKDRRPEDILTYEIRYPDPASFVNHMKSLSGEEFSTSKKIASNTVKLVINHITPVTISFDTKRNKFKLAGKYVIYNQFNEPVCL